ncbi:MAG: hypothetical protein ACREFJ_16455 [Acetobacteraceae bacterium]
MLLGDCIAAEERGREHKAITDKAKRTIAQAERYAGQIARIAQWVRAPIVLDGKNVVSGALDLVAEQIKSRLQNAERVLDERSRKADASGARAMAVGWIREAVLKSSGKPNLDAVKTLAEAALGIDGDEITIHAIRKTVTPSDALWLGYRNAKAGAHPDVLDTSRIAIWSEPARSKDKKPAE